jgi:hypothetical protein
MPKERESAGEVARPGRRRSGLRTEAEGQPDRPRQTAGTEPPDPTEVGPIEAKAEVEQHGAAEGVHRGNAAGGSGDVPTAKAEEASVQTLTDRTPTVEHRGASATTRRPERQEGSRPS